MTDTDASLPSSSSRRSFNPWASNTGRWGAQGFRRRLGRSANARSVLPFVDMSPEKDQEYFADGLAEELLNALSQIPELKVVGRTSCFRFKGKNEDLRTIGRKLNASTILEGSVRRENGRMRITAQLINAADGFHIWSETYNPNDDDLFAVQDQISNSVAQALKVTLIRGAQPLSGTKNSKAYNAYLLGQYYAERRTPENLRKAVEFYYEALKMDSSYALAWVSLAIVQIRQADWGHIPIEAGCPVSPPPPAHAPPSARRA